MRFSERRGPYRVTVFTTPTPPRAGDVDVSVLIQDAASGAIRTDVPARVRARLASGEHETVTRRASQRAATNKLYRAATLPLSVPGRWRIEIELGDPRDDLRAELDLRVERPSPRWVDAWPWLVWPALPIGWFLLRRRSSSS